VCVFPGYLDCIGHGLLIEWWLMIPPSPTIAARLRFAETHETGVDKYIKQENSKTKEDERQ
jgi:hypothetical protein